jgi:hypothetical protein
LREDGELKRFTKQGFTTDYNVHFCTQTFYDKSPGRDHRTWQRLQQGFNILQHVSNIWASSSDVEVVCDKVPKYIENLEPNQQKNLDLICQALVGAADWTRYGRTAVAPGGFKVSAVMIALKVSPKEFAKGFGQGKSGMEVLKGAQDEIASLFGQDSLARMCFVGLAARLRV